MDIVWRHVALFERGMESFIVGIFGWVDVDPLVPTVYQKQSIA